MANTGGGHRSSVEATVEALSIKFPHELEVDVVDVLREYTPFPFKYLDTVYPYLTKSKFIWGSCYHLLNSPVRTERFIKFLWPVVRSSFHKLIENHPSQLILSYHHGFNHALDLVTRERKTAPPHATVVTDLVSTHSFWYSPSATKYFVPTHQAKQHAENFGIDKHKIVVTGLPVSPRFSAATKLDKRQVRASLGLDPEKFTIFVFASGAHGMRNLGDTANALSDSQINAQLIVATGQNPKLFNHLNRARWKIPTLVFEFSREIPKLMRAADVLVTKAGPSTVAEALAIGLPIIITDFLPGQETGNVDHIIKNRAGVLVRDPGRVVETLKDWLANPSILSKLQKSSAKTGKADAAFILADEIYKLIS